MTSWAPTPRWLRAIAARLLVRRDREFLLDDLDDGYAARRAQGRSARVWYLAQALHAGITRRDRNVSGRGAMHAPDRTRSGGLPMTAFVNDIRAAVRGFRRQPGAIAIVVLSLAMGIGAATAMFTVVRGVLLAPLPYSQPDGLVMIWSKWTEFEKTWVSDQEVLDYRAKARTLQNVAAWDSTRVTLTGAGDAIRVGAAMVTANTFDVFGVQPVIGRVFTEDEARSDSRDRPALILASYGLWQRVFGGDAQVLTRQLEINGRPAQVIGVMPRGFRLPTDFSEDAAEPTELWTPLWFNPAQTARDSHGFYAVARLNAGATVAQATADLAAITAGLTREGQYPVNDHFTAFALPVGDEIVGRVRSAILILFGAVAFLMLIGCANAAALLLARAETRQREFATRTALGASRWRLVRQQLVEGLVLAALGGTIGLAFALAAQRVLTTIGAGAVPRADGAVVDWRVALFLVGASAMCALLCSLPPAVRAFRAGLTRGLKDDSAQSSTGRERLRLRHALVVAQMALAVLLLTGAGLMIRSLWSLQRIDLGFRPDHVLTARVAVPDRSYSTPAKIVSYFDRLVTRTRAIPGVASAGVMRVLPIGGTIGTRGMRVEGFVGPHNQLQTADWQVVTGGAIEALGERLLRGRLITDDDTATTQPVAVINETMAATYWPGRDALGGRIQLGGNPNRPFVTIVGVVGDEKHNGITGPVKPKFYAPYSQFALSTNTTPTTGTLIVRATGDPTALGPALRAAAREIDPNVPLTAMRTMDEVVNIAIATPRLTGVVFTAFAGVAIVLSAIGVYGLLVYMVAQRSREIGIRVAVGAGKGQIVGMIFRSGAQMALAGLAIGLILAATLTRVLGSLLHGVTPLDPGTFGAVAVLLLAVAALASFIPASRAARVDPVAALRS